MGLQKIELYTMNAHVCTDLGEQSDMKVWESGGRDLQDRYNSKNGAIYITGE